MNKKLIIFSIIGLMLAVSLTYAYNQAFDGTVDEAQQFGHTADEIVVEEGITLHDKIAQLEADLQASSGTATSTNQALSLTNCRDINLPASGQFGSSQSWSVSPGGNSVVVGMDGSVDDIRVLDENLGREKDVVITQITSVRVCDLTLS